MNSGQAKRPGAVRSMAATVALLVRGRGYRHNTGCARTKAVWAVARRNQRLGRTVSGCGHKLNNSVADGKEKDGDKGLTMFVNNNV